MKSNPMYREMEIKIAADILHLGRFNNWCFSKNPYRYIHTKGPDTYYAQGTNVLRHRKNGEGAGELTVKRRKSIKNTKDRLEIDLRFSEYTTVEDVKSFLKATGWIEQFTVYKDCHIFWFPRVEVVVYDVKCIMPNGTKTAPKRFVEVEISKEHSNEPMMSELLKTWENSMRSKFPMLGNVQTLSLYEIYSGNQYSLVNG